MLHLGHAHHAVVLLERCRPVLAGKTIGHEGDVLVPAAAWSATTRGQSPDSVPASPAAAATAPVTTSAARTSIYAQARQSSQPAPTVR